MKNLLLIFTFLCFCLINSAWGQVTSQQEAQSHQAAFDLPTDIKINKQILDQIKRQEKAHFTPAPRSQNLSYKTQMFSAMGYSVTDVLNWLPGLITKLPPEQQPLFLRAKDLLAQKKYPHAAKTAPALSQEKTFSEWTSFLKTHKPIVLNKQNGNPFSFPDFQKARVILIGEDHTMHYPTEQLVEYLIAYNKAAPEGKRVTHVFIEFSYQGNIAMEFIREHLNDLPEQELLKQAVAYSHKNMEQAISASLREEVRWLRLGYRLLKEMPEVVFYAYDIPNPSIEKRNAAAMAFLQAGYEQPNTKMVFIGGALHMLRENLNTPLFSDSSINAQNSLAHTPGVAPEDIISVLAVGGLIWKEDLKLYGSGNEIDLYHILLALNLDTKQNLAFQTPAIKFGFDYYFFFNSKGKPAVTEANSW